MILGSSCCCGRPCRSGCPRAIWAASSPTWVDQLDLSAITARDEQEERGGPPCHPGMMVKVLLYGCCTGVAWSRRVGQRPHDAIAFRVLAANNTPDFRTISDFRKGHLAV